MPKQAEFEVQQGTLLLWIAVPTTRKMPGKWQLKQHKCLDFRPKQAEPDNFSPNSRPPEAISVDDRFRCHEIRVKITSFERLRLPAYFIGCLPAYTAGSSLDRFLISSLKLVCPVSVRRLAFRGRIARRIPLQISEEIDMHWDAHPRYCPIVSLRTDSCTTWPRTLHYGRRRIFL